LIVNCLSFFRFYRYNIGTTFT